MASNVGPGGVQRGAGSVSDPMRLQRLASATDLSLPQVQSAEVRALPGVGAPVTQAGVTPQLGDGAMSGLGAASERSVVMRLAAGVGSSESGRAESTVAEPVVARMTSAPLAGQSPFVSALGGLQSPANPVAKVGTLEEPIQRSAVAESTVSHPTPAEHQVLSWSVEDRFHSRGGEPAVQRAVAQEANEVRSVSLQEMFAGQQGVVQRDEAP